MVLQWIGVSKKQFETMYLLFSTAVTVDFLKKYGYSDFILKHYIYS